MIPSRRPALREYLDLLEQVPETFRRAWDAIAIYDLDGRLVAGNRAAVQLVGVDVASEIEGRRLSSLMPLRAARRVARSFAECATSGRTMDGEATCLMPDGTELPLRYRLTPARLDGTIVGVITFARDVRDIRAAESLFVKSEQQFRSLFEHHPDALAIHDLEGRFVRINAALTSLSGYTADDLIGQTPAILTGETRAELAALLERVKNGETVAFERVLHTRANEPMQVAGLAVPLLVDGDVRGYCGITRDVSDERRRAAASAHATARIAALFEIAADATIAPAEKIAAALAAARLELRAQLAFVGHVHDGVLTLGHVSADPALEIAAGFTMPIDATLAQRFADERDVFVIDGLSRAAFSAILGAKRSPWRSFVGVPLSGEGEPDGTIGFLCEPATAALDASAHGYVRAVATLIGSARTQAAREQRLDALAFHDPLTGLPNRTLLADRLERALLSARRNRRSFAVHYVDIDHFKEVNDHHGHVTGDAVLVAVAAWLQARVRDSDTVARVGGDEFVLLQPDIDAAQQAEDVAARLVTIHDAPLSIGDARIDVRLSVGFAVFPADGGTADEMMLAADAALYEVKQNGRDGYAPRTPAAH